MLRTRVLTAVVLVPVIVGIVLVGEPWISILVGLVVFLSLVEMISLLDSAGFEPPQVLGIAAGVATAAAGLIATNASSVGGLLADLLRITQRPGLVAAAFIASLILLGVAGFTRTDPRKGFTTWAVTAFGVGYVGILAPTIALVAHVGPPGGTDESGTGPLLLRSGAAWALMLLLVVWGYDTGAYMTGRWLGRRRLIDHISPSKTIEGMAGGLIAATLAAGIGAWMIGLPPWHPLLIGPIVGLAAQAGDLAESMLKRAAGRKESGFVIPGHGGILDRVDSFLFAAPILVAYALFVAGYVV